jgi:DNA-binding NarL/FixJ family response regulator
MVRVALLTDQAVLAKGLAAVLLSEGDFELTATHSPTAEALADIAASNPDILLLDVVQEVPFRAIQELRRTAPNCRILLWVSSVSVQVARRAIDLGIRGILRKNLPIDLLLRCLRRVSEGELWFDRGLTQSLLDARTVNLTQRETQLLNLVVHGLSNKEIADALMLSEGTVKYYFARLFRKTGVRDRFELAFYGLKNLGSDFGQDFGEGHFAAGPGRISLILDRPSRNRA